MQILPPVEYKSEIFFQGTIPFQQENRLFAEIVRNQFGFRRSFAIKLIVIISGSKEELS